MSFNHMYTNRISLYHSDSSYKINRLVAISIEQRTLVSWTYSYDELIAYYLFWLVAAANVEPLFVDLFLYKIGVYMTLPGRVQVSAGYPYTL